MGRRRITMGRSSVGVCTPADVWHASSFLSLVLFYGSLWLPCSIASPKKAARTCLDRRAQRYARWGRLSLHPRPCACLLRLRIAAGAGWNKPTAVESQLCHQPNLASGQFLEGDIDLNRFALLSSWEPYR